MAGRGNDEQAVLAETDDPEEAYMEELMLHKLEMYRRYVEDQNFWLDLRLILATLGRIVGLEGGKMGRLGDERGSQNENLSRCMLLESPI